MAEKAALIINGRFPHSVRKAFRHFQSLFGAENVVWSIKGETFYVRCSLENTERVKRIAHAAGLLVGKPSEVLAKEVLVLPPSKPTTVFLHPNPAEHKVVPPPEEAKRKRRGSRRPIDTELAASLTKRGLDATARRYGVNADTVRRWAKEVPEAREALGARV